MNWCWSSIVLVLYQYGHLKKVFWVITFYLVKRRTSRKPRMRAEMEGHSQVGVFDFETDDWGAYKEHLEHLFEVNGHAETDEEDQKRRWRNLWNVCRKRTYELLRMLSAPNKLAEKTYEELAVLIVGRCSTKPSLGILRFSFRLCNRVPSESCNGVRNIVQKVESRLWIYFWYEWTS